MFIVKKEDILLKFYVDVIIYFLIILYSIIIYIVFYKNKNNFEVFFYFYYFIKLIEMWVGFLIIEDLFIEWCIVLNMIRIREKCNSDEIYVIIDGW